MGELIGSKTEANLLKAFSVESEQRNKYVYFAEVAKKEGLLQIADILKKNALNEEAHAKVWYNILNSGVGSTYDNILEAIEEEAEEYEEMYLEFEMEARKEGFDAIADLFKKVAKIEKGHKEELNKIIEMLDNNHIFEKDKETVWECANCGYTVVSKKAPEECEVCKMKKESFRNKQSI